MSDPITTVRLNQLDEGAELEPTDLLLFQRGDAPAQVTPVQAMMNFIEESGVGAVAAATAVAARDLTIAAKDEALEAAGLIAPVIITSSSGNSFDKTALIDGYSLVAGELSAYPAEGDANPAYATIASQVTPLINVRGWKDITVWGLPENTANGSNFSRPYALYAADGETVLGTGSLDYDADIATIPNDVEAPFFRFVFSQRSGLGLNAATVQVEEGTEATDYKDFVGDTVAGIGGRVLLQPKVPVVEYVGTSDQLFDASQVRPGYEVYGDGSLSPQATSSYILIYVGELQGKDITVSGLQPADEQPRLFSFYNAKPNTDDTAAAIAAKLSGGGFGTDVDGGTVTVHPAALWMAASAWQRSSSPADYSNVVIRVGDMPAVGPVPFKPRVGLLDGIGLASSGASEAALAGAGRKATAVGDSRYESNNVEAGSYLHPDGYRASPVDVIQAKLAFDAYYNFARSGAAFAEIPSAAPFQKINHQITIMLAYAPAADPYLCDISALTNDIGMVLSVNPVTGYGGFGTVAGAMAKTLYVDESGDVVHTLDLSITMDAMRFAFWRLRRAGINRLNYKTPAQRGDFSPAEMKPYVDMAVEMARIYGAKIIDQFGRLPILHEFEGGSITASIADTAMTVIATRMQTPLAVGNVVFDHPSLVGEISIVAIPEGGGVGVYTLSGPPAAPIASTTLKIRGGRFLSDGLHSGAAGQQFEGDLSVEETLPMLRL